MIASNYQSNLLVSMIFFESTERVEILTLTGNKFRMVVKANSGNDKQE